MKLIIKKQRKPRGYKATGERALDMCQGCIAFNCDPGSMSRKFSDKVHRRLAAGQCHACGHPKEACRCKSSLDKGINPVKEAAFEQKEFKKTMDRITEQRRKRLEGRS